ncbi:MAG: MFS transporter [Parerythrobacter sp.]
MADNLTRRQEYALAIITGITVANAYYIHPIISEVGRDFDVGPATIGLVPALNQLALALGILLLLPLGDRFANRTLCIVFATAQTVALSAMLLAPDFALFLVASTVLGFFTIAPYILPAYASRRVAPERIGHVTGILTAGIIFGILFARTGAGVITELFGWRTVYGVAVGAMIVVTATLPFTMEPRSASAKTRESGSYFALISSIVTLLRQYPQVVLSGVIQAFNFGIFLSVWLGLALHLTGPAMGYGVDSVGYLAAFSAVSIYATPRLGRWADRIGAPRARVRIALVQLAAVALLWPFGSSLLLLLIPIIVMNAVGPAIDVAGRMTFLGLDPDIRTRLMTAFIVIMFIGGGVASWAGTAVYEAAGWGGNAVLALAMSGVVVGLSVLAARRETSGAPDRI